MAIEPTPTPNSPAPAPAPLAPPPSLIGSPPAAAPDAPPPPAGMPEGFEGGADAWGKLDATAQTTAATAAADAAKAASAVRTGAWTAAKEPDARKAAYAALNADEKAAAFKALPEADRKALGIEDPAIPQYTEFKLPEGFTVDKTALSDAEKLFKEARLPQEQAQKFITLAAERERAAVERQVGAYNELQTKWQGEVMADPEIGGDKWQASKAAVDRLTDRLNIPGLKSALNLTGAGNNPDIVKAFVRLGNMVTEDKLLAGAAGKSPAAQSPAQTIYGDDPSKPS